MHHGGHTSCNQQLNELCEASDLLPLFHSAAAAMLGRHGRAVPLVLKADPRSPAGLPLLCDAAYICWHASEGLKSPHCVLWAAALAP